MAGVPPIVLQIAQRLPESAQEKLQAAMVRAFSDPYYPAVASVPALFTLAYLPHLGKLFVRFKQTGLKYNNDTPRTEKDSDYPKIQARFSGAHLNALEMFPAFAAAVILARIQKADPQRLVALCISHLKLRLLYNVLYALGVNRLINAGRTTAWFLLLRNLLEIYSTGLF
mmetsp:Transcript_20286/g.57836  ORF Transcript_20286/g.57836 Transcript_20286/m.57836 type:complete len:170 (-) Transcript_20286:163-672(-)